MNARLGTYSTIASMEAKCCMVHVVRYHVPHVRDELVGVTVASEVHLASLHMVHHLTIDTVPSHQLPHQVCLPKL